MITFEEAYKIIMEQAVPLSKERVQLAESCGRILAEDIFSDMDMPPFDKSAVDGFACRSSDIFVGTQHVVSPLQVIETIPAGKIPEKKIKPGQCSKIMTGAMLPEGSECIVMVEDSEMLDENHVRFVRTGTAKNICLRGEDIKAGDRLLSKGTFIAPQHIAVLATAGAVNPLVYRKVRVGILSTGDELVEPSEKPGLSKIRNSNAFQLRAQVDRIHATSAYFGIALDDQQSLHEKIGAAFKSNDVVILSGGVSMGEFDYVPEVLEKIGVNVLVKSIAIQPGRPTVFGTTGDRFIFGLPGNPVSSFVIFELLVRPFLMKMMGYIGELPWMPMTMGKDYKRMKTERKSLIPVKIIDGEVFPVEYHGSAHINAWSAADGIISLKIGMTTLKKGEKVYVRQV